MGSNSGDDDERPVHSVTLSDYSIGKYEVTVGQYRAFCEDLGRRMPEEPEWGWNDRHPIVNVTYNDAVAYCNWLSEKFGGNWRLPTEAEWEYASKGGSQSRGYIYAGGNDMDILGWYTDNSGAQTNAVGRKKPNELGIYDMSGNVWEWCRDWYGAYPSSAAANPRGPSSASYRVLRGGSWSLSAVVCRVSFRISGIPSSRFGNHGFRVVLSQ